MRIRCSPSETGAQLGKQSLQSSAIFALRDIRTAIVLVANTHAHVS